MRKYLKFLVPVLAVAALLLPLTVSDYDGTTKEAFNSYHYESPDVSSAKMSKKSTEDPRSVENADIPLTVAIQQPDGIFSPFFAENGYDGDIVTLTQLPLIRFGRDGSPVAGIDEATFAYRFSQAVSEDGTCTFEFILKNGIKSSDGHVLDADDLLFNLYVYLDPAYSGPSELSSLPIAGLDKYRSSSDIKSISGIRVGRVVCDDGVTREKVSVVLQSADSCAVFKFGFGVAPMHYYAGEERHGRADGEGYFGVDFDSADFMAELRAKSSLPLGAGPYAAADHYGSMTLSEEDFCRDGVYYFTANDDFLLGAPNIKRVWMKVPAGLTNAEAVMTGAADICRTASDASLIEALSGDVSYSELGYISDESEGYGFICVNAGYLPDIRERRALFSVFDVSRVKEFLGDDTVLITRPMNSLSDLYPDGAEEVYPFDVSGETAKDLYSEMGCVKGEDGVMRRSDGSPIKYTFCLPADTASHPCGAVFLEAQRILSSLGITVSIKSDQRMISRVLSGDYAIWAGEWYTGPDPDLYSIFYPDANKNPSAYPGLFGLYSLFSGGTEEEKRLSAELAGYIVSSRTEKEYEARRDSYAMALDRIMELSVILPAYQRKELWIYSKARLNTASITADGRYADPLEALWKVSFKSAEK